MTKLSVLLALLPGLAFPAALQAAGLIDAEDGMLDMGEYMSDSRYGFLPVPVVITEPAVGYGGGLFGLFYMTPANPMKHLAQAGAARHPQSAPLAAGLRKMAPGLSVAGIDTPGIMTAFAILWP